MQLQNELNYSEYDYTVTQKRQNKTNKIGTMVTKML